MKKLGIIGGMGPMASQLFYKILTEHTLAKKDQDHITVFILSDTEMPDRTEAILSENKDKITVVRNQILKDALLLQEAGCDAIAITCNTAHYFVNMISKAEALHIPILHMISLTANAVSEECRNNNQKVAILATNGTIKTGLYQKALADAGMEYYLPENNTQKLIMHEIYDHIKAGKPYDKIAWQAIEDELKAEHCGRAIMACTELSVIKKENSLSEFYIDPMQVLARYAIEYCGAVWKD